MGSTVRVDPAVRFWASVEKTETCWLWRGSTSVGYGQFYVDGRLIGAHRYSLSLIEPLVPGLDIDHLCRVPACVRPSHLEQVTRSVNNLRGLIGMNRNRATHCRRGHVFDEANTVINSNGYRECRTCNRDRKRNRRKADRDYWAAGSF